jgi:hypothetical protein
MMLLFWATSLTGGVFDGLPIGHGWLISEHLVYTAGLFALASLGAGRLLGVDGWVEQRRAGPQHSSAEVVAGLALPEHRLPMFGKSD